MVSERSWWFWPTSAKNSVISNDSSLMVGGGAIIVVGLRYSCMDTKGRVHTQRVTRRDDQDMGNGEKFVIKAEFVDIYCFIL